MDWIIGRDFGRIADDRNRHCTDSDCNLAAFASVTYVACIAARELLEPRLLGAQIGLPPVLMLLSVYAGVKVFGAGGIFLGPLYTVLYTEGLRQIFCRS